MGKFNKVVALTLVFVLAFAGAALAAPTKVNIQDTDSNVYQYNFAQVTGNATLKDKFITRFKSSFLAGKSIFVFDSNAPTGKGYDFKNTFAAGGYDKMTTFEGATVAANKYVTGITNGNEDITTTEPSLTFKVGGVAKTSVGVSVDDAVYVGVYDANGDVDTINAVNTTPGGIATVSYVGTTISVKGVAVGATTVTVTATKGATQYTATFGVQVTGPTGKYVITTGNIPAIGQFVLSEVSGLTNAGFFNVFSSASDTSFLGSDDNGDQLNVAVGAELRNTDVVVKASNYSKLTVKFYSTATSKTPVATATLNSDGTMNITKN